MQCRETIPNYSSFVAEAVSSYVFQIGSKKAAIDRNSISRLIDVLNPPTRRSLQEEEEEMIAMDVDTFRTMIQEQKDVLRKEIHTLLELQQQNQQNQQNSL
jgi:hypothetical protein